MFKSLKKLKSKKDNICARTGCNNQIKRGNGTEFNYCSSSCQRSHYAPGSSEFYDEISEAPAYTFTSSNQWGVWTPDHGDAPPAYSSINNTNDELFNALDDIQVTPLWETDNGPPSSTSNTSNSRSSSRQVDVDDFPVWLGSSADPQWTSSNRDSSSRNYSPPFTSRSSSPSDEEEINCPTCTFFIRPNKTVCEMCGTSITRPEPKRSFKSSSKPKATITSYRDLYEEDEEEEEEEEEEEVSGRGIEEELEDFNPFADPQPRSSYSSTDNYRRNSSSSKSRSRSSYSSYSNDFEDPPYSQSRNQSSRNQSSRNQSSRNRTSNLYQTPTPPRDELWIEDNDFFIEPVPTRKPTRQKPPPKPYSTPSFLREASRGEPRRNVQRPSTPPSKNNITCSACNFDNHPSMTHCEICYTQLNKTPESNNKRNTSIFNRIEERKPTRACPVCSFDNDADRVQCEMCYSLIDTVRNSTFNKPSFSHDPDMVQCPACTFMNHKSMPQCEMCRVVIPGNNLQQQQQQYQQIIDNIPGDVTKMFLLPIDDHDYMTTQQFFRTGLPNARILAIFRMVMPKRLVDAHEAYKKQISGNNPAANVTHRMFHGTHVSCDAKRYYGALGWKHCTANDCGLCGISQNGNVCAKSKYGGRMWFANNSATSLGYCRTDPIKAMFIQDIISATGGPIIIVDREAATLVKFLVIFQS